MLRTPAQDGIRGGATGPGPGRIQGRPVVMTQQWAEIVWVHWRVPPELIATMLPPGLTVDTFDGSAWVGFIPFEMRHLRLAVAGRRLPAIGSSGSFSEVNVRTYVSGPHGPGVWFHSLDANSRLAVAVARAAWSLPYMAADVESDLTARRRSWTVQRRSGPSGSLAVTVGARRSVGALDAFLTARFRLYAGLGTRWLLTAPVRHRPWPLYEATVEGLDPGLVVAAGYPPVGRPDHVLAGGSVEVAIGMPQLVRR